MFSLKKLVTPLLFGMLLLPAVSFAQKVKQQEYEPQKDANFNIRLLPYLHVMNNPGWGAQLEMKLVDEFSFIIGGFGSYGKVSIPEQQFVTQIGGDMTLRYYMAFATAPKGIHVDATLGLASLNLTNDREPNGKAVLQAMFFSPSIGYQWMSKAGLTLDAFAGPMILGGRTDVQSGVRFNGVRATGLGFRAGVSVGYAF